MRFSELDGARVGVWGAGRETRSLAAQLQRRLRSAEIAVIALDVPPGQGTWRDAEEGARTALSAPQAQVVDAAGAVQALAGCDVVVRSPGVSIHRSELAQLRAGGTPVTTATSLWLAERSGDRVIGVTGTKGKSTTSALIHALLGAAGVDARLAGNIGTPALDLLDEPGEAAVVELSSYQTADLAWGPQVAAVTNLHAEHLDWHGSHERYRAEKLRLLDLPGVRRCVLNARDERLHALTPGAPVDWFGRADGYDASGAGDLLYEGRVLLPADELPLRGPHNALNLAAALTAVRAFGVDPPALPTALEGFAALPHRLEVVHEQDGVTWVDDSISTTPESTIAALASFPGREIVLIAGGQERGQELAPLLAALLARDAAVPGSTVLIAIPSTGPRLLAAAVAAGLQRQHALAAEDLPEAVARARALAAPGAVVLLSPAAPSFDHFRDFEQRGERFAALAGRPAASAPGGG
jgi:UDP-N-acetylmuramoylalanine--D-glutamate ligase